MEAGKALSPYIPEFAEILEVRELTPQEKVFKMRRESGQPLGHKPGQFVEVSIFGYGEAPISISSSPTAGDSFELCVRAVGDLTNALHRMKKGGRVGIRGPFGNGFEVADFKGQDMLFIAAGLGLAPLRSLINYTLDRRADFGRVIILYGSNHPDRLLFRAELAKWEKQKDIEYFVTVDRPDEKWAGNVGVITTLIPKVKLDPARTVAAVVGPPIMYKFVLAELMIRGLSEDKIFASLERRMKCGLGKCGHCQINKMYVCQEGPVFTFKQIRGLGEAI